MRPQAILWFERLYLASAGLSVLNQLIFWDRNERVVETSGLADVVPGYHLLSFAISAAIPLTLWFLIARRGSAVARLIFAVLLALGVLSTAWVVAKGAWATGPSGLIGYAAVALQLAAAWYVFRPEASAWFAGRQTRENAG